MFGQKDYLINNGLLKCDLYFQTLIDFIIALAKQSKSAGVQLNSWWRHQMSGCRRIVLKLRRITACATIEIYVAFPEFFSGQKDKRLPWLAYACLGFCGILFSQTICIIELLNCCRLLQVSISRKQILNFSFEPKNQQKYFCISALASKSGLIKKI